MDLGPFREHRDFRLLLIAGTVFYLGGMMTYVAIPYQIYQLTGSNLAVGAVGLVELVPLIVFGLYGGALADHFDRRLLLIWTGIAQAAFTAWLAINAFSPHPRLWEIFLVSGLLASASALQRPSREALLPRTVRHDEIVAANALSSLGMQSGVLVGPAIGGVLVASFGPGWCFLVDIVGLFVASMLYAAMRRYPHVGETEPPSFNGIKKGLRYALSRRDLLGTYVVDLIAMMLCSLPWLTRCSGNRSCWGCSTPRRRWARWSRPRSRAGPRGSTVTGVPSSWRRWPTAPASRSPAPRGRSGSACSSSPWPGAPT
jgi:MFS family permease